MELLQYAQQLSNAEVPETIRQSILAERARMTATGVKVCPTCPLGINFSAKIKLYSHQLVILKLYRVYLRIIGLPKQWLKRMRRRLRCTGNRSSLA